jgi:hypothetical protein
MAFHDIGNLTKIKTVKNCLDMRKIKQPFFSYSKLPTTPVSTKNIPKKIPKKSTPRFVQPDMEQTGRTAEEIRAFMIKQDIGVEYIGDIPEIIAQSKDSSYNHAINYDII